MILLNILGTESLLAYLLLLVFVFVIFAIRYVLNVSRIFKEMGSSVSIEDVSIFNFDRLLKWSASHEKKVAFILLAIFLVGIFYAIKI